MRKLLFVSYDFPYPTNTGGKNRAFNLIKYASKDIEVHLVSFIRKDFRKEYEEELKKIKVKTITTFKRRKLADLKNIKALFSENTSIFKSLYYTSERERSILDLIKSLKVNIVHFESYYTAFYMGDNIRNLGVKQVFGTENIEHFLYKEYAKNSNWLKRVLLEKEIRKIEREEKELLKISDKNIAVTEEEANFIEKLTSRQCDIIPNGVDLEKFKYNRPSKEIKNTLLFIGNFAYFPNVNAINYFYNNVFKRLNKNIRLLIIGKNAKKLNMKRDRRVKIIPFIEDIIEIYNMADIMISPIKIGGGTNFKILEAMANGVPIIANPERINSFGVKDGEEIFVAETPSDYLKKIDLLFKDFNLRDKLSKNARKLVERRYSWEKIGKKLNLIWKNM